MSEKDLSRALLHGEKAIDIEALTQRVIKRDRRRIWILGVICVIAWMAVVMLPWGTVLPMLAKIKHHEFNATTMPAHAVNRQDSMALLPLLRRGVVATFLESIVCMFVAAISTVSLIILSRRATLRQVNARLADIAEQLRKPEKP